MFQPSASYLLCKVELSIAKNASEDADLLVTIRTNNAGSPSTTVLATSATVPNATITEDFTFVSFTFASPPALTSGTDYWIVMTRADAADGLQIYWEDDASATVENMKEAANATPTTWVVLSASSAGVYRAYSD